MKKIKYIVFILLMFMCFNVNASAAKYSITNVTCNYKKSTGSIQITYYNVGIKKNSGNLGTEGELYYEVKYKVGGKPVCYSSAKQNTCDSGAGEAMSIYNFDKSKTVNSNDTNIKFYNISDRLMRDNYTDKFSFNNLCSENIFLHTPSDGERKIVLCETSKNSPECDFDNGNLYENFSETHGDITYAGSDEENYQNAHNDASVREEKYCDKDSEYYDEEECEKAKADKEATEEEAKNNGHDIGELVTNKDINFSESDCDSLLGNVKDKNAPAYYLNFAFNLLKYIAIVLLLVLTIMEFTKATASSNQDALKKALQVSVKRIMIVLVIFFLPIIINFILDLLGVVTTDATCGIGK